LEQPLYGARRIAEVASVSPSTLWRWVKDPLNDFMVVGSMSNAGGGLGRALWTYPSSILAFKATMAAAVSEKSKRAAEARWNSSSGGDVQGRAGDACALLAARQAEGGPAASMIAKFDLIAPSPDKVSIPSGHAAPAGGSSRSRRP
jgi:hypothetical protein